MNTFKLSAILLIFLAFASTAFASPSVELSAGQYKLTDESRTVSNDYGVFDAVADDQPATIGASAYTNFGKIKLSVGARTGDSTYEASLSPDAQALSDSNEAAIAGLNDAINVLKAEEAPAEDLAPIEAELASVTASQVELRNQFNTHVSHTGLTASAMYAVTDNVALGAEVFSNSDTDELIPSLKAESSSKHGNITLGATLNAGEDWVGFGTVARF